MNNAGTVFSRRTLTADGIESTFAVNHLGGLLLTELLLDRIRGERTRAARVHVVRGPLLRRRWTSTTSGSSAGYSMMQRLRAFQARERPHRTASRPPPRRAAGSPSTRSHPGAIATNIWSGAPWFARPVLALMKRDGWRRPEVGGSRLAYLATSPEVEGQTGGYYDRNRLREPSELARDDALGERLYDVSARLVGLPV